ncbi:MAG: DUF3866 family protein [Acidimicrobiia bacterium]|nr:DUF3866 family protein [Acidimicrobiia bacterium]
MPAFREADVAAVLSERKGLCRVLLDDGDRAYALTDLIGPVAVGDRVVLNTTAVDLGLGSGGWHVVHWNLTRGPWSQAGPGHLMKLRYTSLQTDTGAGEETGPDEPTRLDELPVVAAGVHSQLPVIAAAVAAERPGSRLVYVMTDGAALPLALSDQVAELTRVGLVAATVTAGHAFGGDVEALNVPSALVLARHRLAADVVVVAMGPGGAGTGTRVGYTALEVAPVLDAVAWLGGRAIACLRCSEADPRSRHVGISHHSTTALEAVRSAVEVPYPPPLEPPAASRHQWVLIDPGDPCELLLAAGLTVTTMGRGPADDRLYFAAAAAAGMWAARAIGPIGGRSRSTGADDSDP